MLLFAVDVLTAMDVLWLTVAMLVIAPFVKGLASALGNALAQYLRERWKQRQQRGEQSGKCDQAAKDNDPDSSPPPK
jgi:hypothetical protein